MKNLNSTPKDLMATNPLDRAIDSDDEIYWLNKN